MGRDDLITLARESQRLAHVPYSGYAVGAALETNDGTTFTGCNIENSNYSNSLHAEEIALAKAVTEGHRAFRRIAVSSDRRDGVTPCGMCRQTLAEFCDESLEIICDLDAESKRYTLGELLPAPITGDMIK